MAYQREPYPAKEKWTPEQERAYAEGRKSARGEGGPSPSSKSGKRKRYVKTDAGARRYGQPIGTEIGNPRNQKAAEAQKDTESTGRYNELVGGDQNTQSKAMRGLSDDQLQRLSRVAYSFKSSDPSVVRLRIGVANELARRGFNVNDYGGLGRGSAPRPAGPPSRAGARPVAKKALGKYTARKPKPARSAMSARKNDRRLRELSVPQLRKSIEVFSRIPQGKRQAVARALVRQALELAAPHFLSETIVEAANLPDATRTKVIELAGRWKHGFIPLDSVALESKMKGRTGGKRWWDGGTGKGGAKGRLHSAVGVPKKGSSRQKAALGRLDAEPDTRRRMMRIRNDGEKKTNVVHARDAGTGFTAKKRDKPSLGTQMQGDRFPVGNAWPGHPSDEFRKQKDGTFSLYRNGKKSRRPEDNGLTRAKAQQHAASIHKTMAASDYQRRTGLSGPIDSPRVKDADRRNAAKRKPGVVRAKDAGEAFTAQPRGRKGPRGEFTDQEGRTWTSDDGQLYTLQDKDMAVVMDRDELEENGAILTPKVAPKKRPGVKGDKASLRRSIAAGNAARARKQAKRGYGGAGSSGKA